MQYAFYSRKSSFPITDSPPPTPNWIPRESGGDIWVWREGGAWEEREVERGECRARSTKRGESPSP